MDIKKLLVFFIIAMFLVTPFAGAKQEVADSVKQDKISEKVTDKTKESAKEISNKDKDIKGKVTVTDSDSSKYTVEKKSKTEISISKSEAKGEHTKSKVTFAKEDLKSIDVDGDGYYGVLHIADDGTTTHGVYTESQLIAGTVMVFSENIVSGYNGVYSKTVYNVTTNQIIDMPDATPNYLTITIPNAPAYTAINMSNPSSYPVAPIAIYTFDGGNANDSSGNGYNGIATGITFSGGYARSSTIGNYISIPYMGLHAGSGNFTIASRVEIENPANISRIFTMANSTNDRIAITSENNIRGGVYNGSYNSRSITYGYSSDPLHFITLRQNNKVNALYFDHIVATNSQSLSSTTNNRIFSGIVGKMDYTIVWDKYLSSSQLIAVHAGGTGVSVRAYPSENWTGYTGTGQTVDTDGVVTSVKILNSYETTLPIVTINEYFTEDITKTTETKGAVYQNVSIIHTKQNATASVGSLAYELDPLYSGDPILTSNNTNATVSRNDTHAIISTGLVKQGQSFSYAISVADDHDHGFHIGDLMKWVGTGWDFVSTAPEDWDDYIGDEIEVTVS